MISSSAQFSKFAPLSGRTAPADATSGPSRIKSRMERSISSLAVFGYAVDAREPCFPEEEEEDDLDDDLDDLDEDDLEEDLDPEPSRSDRRL